MFLKERYQLAIFCLVIASIAYSGEAVLAGHGRAYVVKKTTTRKI